MLVLLDLLFPHQQHGITLTVRLVEGQQADVLLVAEGIFSCDHTIGITQEPFYARDQRNTLPGVMNHDFAGMHGLAAQGLLQLLHVLKQYAGIISALNPKHLAKVVSRSLAT